MEIRLRKLTPDRREISVRATEIGRRSAARSSPKRRWPALRLGLVGLLASIGALTASCGSGGGAPTSEALANEVVISLAAGDFAAVAELAPPGWDGAAGDAETRAAVEEGVGLENWCYTIDENFPDAHSIRLYADAVGDTVVTPWTTQFPAYRANGAWSAGFGTPPEREDRSSTSVDPDQWPPLPPRPARPRPDDCTVPAN